MPLNTVELWYHLLSFSESMVIRIFGRGFGAGVVTCITFRHGNVLKIEDRRLSRLDVVPVGFHSFAGRNLN
jgi:hypothetical protein